MSSRARKKKAEHRRKSVGLCLCRSSQWIAVATLAAYATVGLQRSFAQKPASTARVSQTSDQSQSGPVRRFDIKPGTLGSALAEFTRLTHYETILNNEKLAAVPSPGVTGLYTDEQALRQILKKTGASCRKTSDQGFEIYLQGGEASIDVVASAEPINSPKFTQALIDTPQTVTGVSQQVMSEQGVTTLRDALRNVAGISLAAGEGGSQGDNLTLRGFTARNDIYLDGMRDFGSYYRDPFNLENVQVLEGPSSALFGRGSTGGIIEQESKTPESKRFVSGNVDLGSDLTRRVTLDINQPLNVLPQGSGLRLNLMGNDNKVAGRDIAEGRRFGVAPSLAIALNPATMLTFNYIHEGADDTPDYGVPWLFNAPAPVARQNYYGFEQGNYLRTNDDIATARLDHQVNQAIRVHEQVRYANYDRDVRITEAKIAGSVTASTPLDQIDVTRNQIAVKSSESFLQDQFDVVVDFRTGPIRHTLVTGVEGGRETSNPTRFAYTGVPNTSLLDPDESQAFSGLATTSSSVHTTAYSVGAYALDTIKLGSRWQVTGGGRWDRFDTAYSQSVTPAAAFSRVDEMLSWRGAVLFKPAQNGSLYFDVGTSFNPSAESLSLSAATANTPPEKNLTYEIGSKWEFAQHHLSLRSSIFRTVKNNAREPDPDNPLLNVLSGTQRVNGFEFEASGRITDRWNLTTSYALFDSRVVKSIFYPLSIGARLPNVPRNSFTLWSIYRMPWHIQTGGGAQFVDTRTASSTAPFDPITGLLKAVPGYWTLSAMVKYPLGEHVDLQANITNLTNAYYFDQIHPGHIVPGAGRAIVTGLKFKF